MYQYNPVVSGKRLKSGVVLAGWTTRVCGKAAHLPWEPYVGGLNPLASQPSAPEVRGSLDTTFVSMRPHFWHSNVP
jgi:hypothetical protein